VRQRQDSVTDQLKELVVIAEREHGMHDAADWIRRLLETSNLAKGTRVQHRLVEARFEGTVLSFEPDGRLKVRWDNGGEGLVWPQRLVRVT